MSIFSVIFAVAIQWESWRTSNRSRLYSESIFNPAANYFVFLFAYDRVRPIRNNLPHHTGNARS